MAEATSAIAWFAEAQARFTLKAGTAAGRPVPRTTSRPRFGALTDGITWPITTVPIDSGAISVRSTSSRTHAFARSSAVRSRYTVPALANGVRQPATTATRAFALIRGVGLAKGARTAILSHRGRQGPGARRSTPSSSLTPRDRDAILLSIMRFGIGRPDR